MEMRFEIDSVLRRLSEYCVVFWLRHVSKLEVLDGVMETRATSEHFSCAY